MYQSPNGGFAALVNDPTRSGITNGDTPARRGMYDHQRSNYIYHSDYGSTSAFADAYNTKSATVSTPSRNSEVLRHRTSLEDDVTLDMRRAKKCSKGRRAWMVLLVTQILVMLAVLGLWAYRVCCAPIPLYISSCTFAYLMSAFIYMLLSLALPCCSFSCDSFFSFTPLTSITSYPLPFIHTSRCVCK